MDIKVTKQGKRKQLHFSGEMSIYAAQTAKEIIFSDIEQYQELHFHLAEISEIDCTGIQLLLLTAQVCEEKSINFIIDDISENILDTLTFINLSNTFDKHLPLNQG